MTSTSTVGTITVTVADSAGNTAYTYVYVTSSSSGSGNSNVAVLTVAFTALNAEIPGLSPGCTASAPWGQDCAADIDRYCQNTGTGTNYSTGFGPIASDGTNATITCLSAEEVQPINTNFITLHNNDTNCADNGGNPYSEGCQQASFQTCVDQGYTSGFGPLEESNGDEANAKIACTAGTVYYPSFATLAGDNSACTASTVESIQCAYAYAEYCVAQGFVSGYGFYSGSGSTNTVTCLK